MKKIGLVVMIVMLMLCILPIKVVAATQYQNISRSNNLKIGNYVLKVKDKKVISYNYKTKEKKTIIKGFKGNSLCFDGKKVLYGKNYRIYSMNPNGTNNKALMKCKSENPVPFALINNRLYYDDGKRPADPNLFLYNLNTKKIKNLGMYLRFIRIDGNYVYFCSVIYQVGPATIKAVDIKSDKVYTISKKVLNGNIYSRNNNLFYSQIEGDCNKKTRNFNKVLVRKSSLNGKKSRTIGSFKGINTFYESSKYIIYSKYISEKMYLVVQDLKTKKSFHMAGFDYTNRKFIMSNDKDMYYYTSVYNFGINANLGTLYKCDLKTGKSKKMKEISNCSEIKTIIGNTICYYDKKVQYKEAKF